MSAAKTGKKIKVTQTGSKNAGTESQIKSLLGLGLKRMHQSRVLEDTPSVRGMVRKVAHLVKVEEV